MCEFVQGVFVSGGEFRTVKCIVCNHNIITLGHSLSISSILVGIYCCLELDEYGKFERKARTLPVTMDNATLITTWDQVM